MRSPLPFALALFTDEERHPDIVSLMERLPGAGLLPPLLIVFRHYGLRAGDRAVLAHRAAVVARRKGHLFVTARGSFGDGAHNGWSRGLRTVSVHGPREGAAKAAALRPHLGFVSPVFPTRSHPGAAALGPARASAIAQRLPYPAFALGGVDDLSTKRLIGTPFCGIAAIGAFGP
ncbi:thiamine phosphate synthase [Parvularcula oceani]|uniref:thiamine phosphate synthase n=1 Tax=Parvularcula oceani TaxID=1247963 RepID=UPI00068DD90F|nr:thiamine phosphate synthase [Parvularcula oceani]